MPKNCNVSISCSNRIHQVVNLVMSSFLFHLQFQSCKIQLLSHFLCIFFTFCNDLWNKASLIKIILLNLLFCIVKCMVYYFL